MEDVLLVDVDVDHLVPLLGVAGDEVLDGVDLVVDEVLAPLDVAREAAHAVVDDDDVGLEAVYEEVEGAQRRDAPAGGDVDVGAEGADAAVRVALGIGVDRDVALVEVRDHGLRQRPRRLDLARLLAGDAARGDRLLRDEHGDARTLGLVVLAGDVENVGADHVGDLGQDLGQPLGVVGLVDVVDVLAPLRLRLRVADVVDVEAQGLGEVVEAVELELAKRLDLRHGGVLPGPSAH